MQVRRLWMLYFFINFYLSLTFDSDPFNTATGLVLKPPSIRIGPGISMVNPVGGSRFVFVFTV